MKIIKYIFIVSMIFTYSCYKDLGNYDYNYNGQLEGATVTGLESKYTVEYLSNIEINAEVEDSDKYEYFWTIGTQGVKPTVIPDTLEFTTPNIIFAADIPANIYSLVLHVKCKEPEYVQKFTTTVTVVKKDSRGWFILKTLDDKTEMDFATLSADSTSLSQNLLEGILGYDLMGEAYSFNFLPGYTHKNMEEGQKYEPLIIASSNQSAVVISAYDMMEFKPYSEMFYDSNPGLPEKFSQFTVKVFGTSQNAAYDKEVYASTLNILAPLKDDLNDDIKPSKYFIDSGSSCEIMFFDLEKHNFVGSTDFMGVYTHPDDGDLTYRNVNMTPVYACAAYESGNSNFIMKHNEEDVMKAFRFETYGYYDWNPMTKITEIPVEIEGVRHPMYDATMFAHSSRTQVVYYVKGNNIYYSDLNLEVINFVKFWTPEEGEEISFIKNIFWNDKDDLDNKFEYFVVGTHKDGKYKLQFYTVLNGGVDIDPQVEPIILEGDGIVSGVHYRSPVMDLWTNGAQYSFL